jgi:peptidoglycan/xylan/chitin deacetylase (PgdA/CDA1 family)
LKADDYGCGNDSNWKRFNNNILNRNLKANLGINANYRVRSASLKHYIKNAFGVDKNAIFWSETKKLIHTGNFELWNHSYVHENFQDITSESVVKKLIAENQKIVSKRLNYTMIAFGAPYNKISTLMKDFLESQNEIKIWLYGLPDSTVPLVLHREINLEDANLHPNFSLFESKYQETVEKSDNDYLCIQLHPAEHDKALAYEVEKFLDFLTEKGHIFVTLTEYFEFCKNQCNQK